MFRERLRFGLWSRSLSDLGIRLVDGGRGLVSARKE